ncbi:GIY-YIG nuclease family protein [Patescibacteria group bacterium]|nr:GIY-YIG nuclease family protein [Patescibacteria group bacterium]
MWKIYIVECSDKTLYTGVTTDLERRVEEHNSSRLGACYTRGRRPVKLVYSCDAVSRAEAQKKEYRIKKLSAKKKRELCRQKN